MVLDFFNFSQLCITNLTKIDIHSLPFSKFLINFTFQKNKLTIPINNPILIVN